MPFRWQLSLDTHPDYRSTGAKITSVMLAAEKTAFLNTEEAFHVAMIGQSNRGDDHHGEWITWQGEDIGTRLLLYSTAFKSIAGNDDWTHWGAIESALPYELYPTAGTSIDRDRSTYQLVQSYTRDLAAVYDTLAARFNPKKTMTWQQYKAAHPEVVVTGDRWTSAMTPAETAQFNTLEAGLINWGSQNSTASSAGVTEWKAGLSTGLRLLMYASAADTGLSNPQSVASLFPPIIGEPKDPGTAAVWLSGIKLFADLRDAVRKRMGVRQGDFTLSPSDISTGSSLVPGGTVTNTSQSGSSSGGIGILLLVALAVFAMGRK